MEAFKYHPHPRPYYPWVIWILCILFIFYNYIIQFAALFINIPLHTKTVANVVNIAHLFDPYALTAFLLQIPVALLIDKYGPRKTTSLAIVITGLGAILFGFSTSMVEIGIAVAIFGVGSTVTIVNALKLASNWFLPSRFAVLVGLTMTAAALGAAVGQPLAHTIIQTLGWRQLMVNLGIIGIVYALLFFSIVRENALGARYSVYPSKLLIPYRVALKKVFKNPQNYLVALFFGLAMSPWVSYFGVWHIPFFQTTYHVSHQEAFIVNVINVIAFGVGAPFFGWISTRHKSRKRFMFLGIIIALILNGCTIYVPSIPFPVVGILTSLSGFFISASTLSYAMSAEKNNPTAYASVFALLYVSALFFRMILDRVIGYIFTSALQSRNVQNFEDITINDYQTSLVIVPIVLILSLLVLFFIKETHAEPSYE
ncbi:MAG: MFS transporter [Simkaniaceae bacterium]